MAANPVLFRDLTYIFLAALAGGLLAWRLRLPLILSFVLVQVARSSGIVGENIFSATIAGSLVSIFLNVFIVRGTLGWLGRKFSPAVAAAAQGWRWRTRTVHRPSEG